MMSAKLKILYIHQDGKRTGSAISLRNLLSSIDRNLFEPYVLLASEGPARKLYEDLNINVDVVSIRPFWTAPGPRYFEMGFFRNFLALLPNRDLRDYLLTLKPDIVHINDKAMLSAGLTAKSLGLPIIWHLRSTYFITLARIHALISRILILHCSDRLIAISEDEIDGFEGCENLKIIFNTVDFDEAENALEARNQTRKELKLRDNEIVVGLIGSLDERKGAWEFIEAAALAQNATSHIDYRFVILAAIPNREMRSVGGLRGRFRLVKEIHPEDKAYQLARQVGIIDRLILTGHRNDPLKVIASFDIAVVANRLGVLGRPPFEAMSVGRPLIVTSGHSGNSTVVQPNRTAILIPPQDVAAMGTAIAELSQSISLRQAMGQAGEQYSKVHFDPIKNTKEIEKIYKHLISQKRRGL